MLAFRGLFSRVRGFFTGSNAAIKEAQELVCLNKYSKIANCLSGSHFSSPYYLHEVTNIIRSANFKNGVGQNKNVRIIPNTTNRSNP